MGQGWRSGLRRQRPGDNSLTAVKTLLIPNYEYYLVICNFVALKSVGINTHFVAKQSLHKYHHDRLGLFGFNLLSYTTLLLR
jgi:hypothetical protein